MAILTNYNLRNRKAPELIRRHFLLYLHLHDLSLADEDCLLDSFSVVCLSESTSSIVKPPQEQLHGLGANNDAQNPFFSFSYPYPITLKY